MGQIQVCSIFMCSQEYTFTNTQNTSVFFVRKILFLFYKYIRKYIDIYEHL